MNQDRQQALSYKHVPCDREKRTVPQAPRRFTQSDLNWAILKSSSKRSLLKVAPILGDKFGYFEKHHFSSKIVTF